MRRVVVGFDGSPSAKAALDWAAEEARLRRAALEVVTIVEPAPGPRGDNELGAAAFEHVRSAVMAAASHQAVEVTVASGDPASVLCTRSAPSDLLVVGSRGRGGFAGLLLGSVSRACLRHAPCSVAVVRGGGPAHRRWGKVVVGIDTSEYAGHTLTVAAQEAELRGVVLEVVHVVHWDRLGVELIEPTMQQLRSWGRDLVRQKLEASGVRAHSVVLNGNPSDVLVRRSARADLLVVGQHGRGVRGALGLGSTTSHCVQHAHCPVLVVRREPDVGGVGHR